MDVHSFSEPDKVRVTHCSLRLAASFAGRILEGTARLSVERTDQKAPLVLDTRDLQIESVQCGGTPVAFELGPRDPILGSPLIIDLPPAADAVDIRYATRPSASGLQWLNPEQTAGKRDPFLFSQNQSIHARSWIPLQDSPGVRITYDARIQAPDNLCVLMGARHKSKEGGSHFFRMDLPIPPYLIALAIGNLDFAPLGPRTGIYAEPPVLAAAAREFEDTERLVEKIDRTAVTRFISAVHLRQENQSPTFAIRDRKQKPQQPGIATIRHRTATRNEPRPAGSAQRGSRIEKRGKRRRQRREKADARGKDNSPIRVNGRSPYRSPPIRGQMKLHTRPALRRSFLAASTPQISRQNGRSVSKDAVSIIFQKRRSIHLR